MSWPSDLPLRVESTLQQRPGLRVHAEVGVHTPDGGRQPCLYFRLVAQTVFHLTGSIGQNLSSRERVAPRLTRVRDVEEAHQKLGHLLRGRRLAVGAIAFLRDSPRLDRHHDRERRQEHDQQRRGGDAKPVAPDKLAHPITDGRWTGQDRLIVQMPPDIERQRVRSLVAAGPVLLERLQRDPVEVAAELAHEPGVIGVPILGCVSGRRRHQCRQAPARPWRLLLANRPPDALESRLPQLLPVERQCADQQLVERTPSA